MSIYIITFLLIYLAVASIFDLKTMKIPNVIIVIGLFTAPILVHFGFLSISYKEMILSFSFVFIPLVLFWALGSITQFKVMGAGDVKLFAVLSLYISSKYIFVIFVTSLFLAILFNIRKLKYSNLRSGSKDLMYFIFYGVPGTTDPTTQTRFAYAPFILLSYVLFIAYRYFFI